MATLSITIPDAVYPAVLDALAGHYGYAATVGDPPAPNPETKVAFVRRMVAGHIKHLVQEYRTTQAARQAAATAGSDTDLNNIR